MSDWAIKAAEEQLANEFYYFDRFLKVLLGIHKLDSYEYAKEKVIALLKTTRNLVKGTTTSYDVAKEWSNNDGVGVIFWLSRTEAKYFNSLDTDKLNEKDYQYLLDKAESRTTGALAYFC